MCTRVADFGQFRFPVFELSDLYVKRIGYGFNLFGFLLTHAVVAAHVGDTSRGVVEILRSEQKDEKIVQFVVLVGSINHIRVLFPQLGQFVLHRVNGVVFGADIAVDHLGLFFEVRDDLLTVANTVLDSLSWFWITCLSFFVLASSSFVARISSSALRISSRSASSFGFAPARFSAQRAREN